MQARAQFPPEPRSASAARHWVRAHLCDLGRDDLVPAAEAGVSELVTNGILHAQTSIGLQVSRRQDRVIIEVYDSSPMSDQPTFDTATPSPVESTIGRGLRIVRANAREWGVSTTRHGKSIWFQPAPSAETLTHHAPAGSTNGHGANGHPPVAGETAGVGETTGTGETADIVDIDDDVDDEPFDLDSALDALAEAFPEDVTDETAAEEPVQVRLLGLPVALVQHYRKRWLELVREMQLVALSGDAPHQRVARRFCDAAQAVHHELYVLDRAATDFEPASTHEGVAVDAVCEVLPSRRDAYAQARDLARELESEWAGARLLFVHPGPQAAQLREWWLGEMIAQLDGEPPTRWDGDLSVRDEAFSLHGDA